MEKINPNNNTPALWFDGGSRGNPGLAAGGYRLLAHGEEFIGSQVLPHATNNEAEYTGLIIGLEKAIALGCKAIRIKGDSNLVVNQVNGQWEVRVYHLRPLCDLAQQLLAKFDIASLTWIKRNKNQWADWACNCAMNEAEGLPAPDKPGSNQTQPGLPRIARMVLSPQNFKFKDWAGLKVGNGKGRDEFTSKRLPKLTDLASDFSVELLTAKWASASPAEIAKCYRWFLRARAFCPQGTAEQLSEFAIHKCRVDMEISQNAQMSRRVHGW